MLFALVFVCPIGLGSAAKAFGDPIAIAAGIGVGVSSSVIRTCSTNSRGRISPARPTRSPSRSTGR
jgi:hypothetical protein